MAKPLRRPDVVFRQVGTDEAFLYDPLDRSVHVLNTTAAAVWQLADGTCDVAAIVAELDRRFAVPEGTPLEADVASVLEQLHSLNVLVVEDR